MCVHTSKAIALRWRPSASRESVTSVAVGIYRSSQNPDQPSPRCHCRLKLSLRYGSWRRESNPGFHPAAREEMETRKRKRERGSELKVDAVKEVVF